MYTILLITTVESGPKDGLAPYILVHTDPLGIFTYKTPNPEP